MDAISGYSSPFNFGHKALEHLWDGQVDVQEKIDGSNLSFRKCNGVLQIRTRKVDISYTATNPAAAGMFDKAVETIASLAPALQPGWIYRGEYLCAPKHNALRYERVPVNHIIIFDIDRGDQDYLPYEELAAEAERIGLECVPLIARLISGPKTAKELLPLLDRVSILGGTNIEGIVLKNHNQYGPDKKVLMGKLVAKDFREVQPGEWRKANPTKKDAVQRIIEMYRTEARWRKAVQHLNEDGRLQNAPQDIGLLITEVPTDILEEDRDTIKEQLFEAFWPEIKRGVTRGFPEWYRQMLLTNMQNG